MIPLRTFAGTVLALVALAVVAPLTLAQDKVPEDPATAPAAPTTLSLRAIDISAMLAEFHRGTKEPADVPLADRAVKVLVAAAKGGSATTIDVRTDAAGRLEVPLAGVAPGTTLEFLVPDPSSDGRWPLYAAAPLTAGTKPPSELAFVLVEDGDSPLQYGTFSLVATVPDLAEGSPSIRVNLIASVRNAGHKMWIGKKGDLDRGALRIRIPSGFQVVGAQAAGHDVQADVVAADGGQDVVLRERIWPTTLSGEDVTVRLVLTGKYAEDGVYDFSFRAEHPIEQFSLNLEEGVLTYDESDGVELADAGTMEAMKGRITHAWRATGITAGSVVGARIRVGASPIHPKVWLTLGTLALVIAGAAFLAKALSRRSDVPAPGAVVTAPPVPLDQREDKIRELDRRLQRGEITSFEHAARKKVLEGGTRAAPPAAVRPGEPPRKGTPEAMTRELLDEISSRVERADADTLRRDVRSLLALVRGLTR